MKQNAKFWKHSKLSLTPHPSDNSEIFDFQKSWKNADPSLDQIKISEIKNLWMTAYPLRALPHQEQNPIMNFAVPFLKMLTHYLLWRAKFLSDFYAVFCVHQIVILLPL